MRRYMMFLLGSYYLSLRWLRGLQDAMKDYSLPFILCFYVYP